MRIAVATEDRSPPTTRNRLIGRAITTVVMRAPWAWPLLRHSVNRFFTARAPSWDERVDAGSPEHLAALAAAALYVKPHPERVLELGTGTGEGALMLAREFPAATIRGIDVSEEMIRAARHKVGLDPEARVAFAVGDASALAYDDDSFDLVAQLNMPPFAGEVARVLRPGGCFVIASSFGPATPFYASPEELRRAFSRHRVSEVAAGSVAGGSFWVGRLAGAGD